MSLFTGIFKTIIAIIFPPLAVGIETGLSLDLLLNILLTILGWIPGVLHAIYIIYMR